MRRGYSRRAIHLAVVTVTAAIAVGSQAALAGAREAPVKEVLSSTLGLEVDRTTHGNICPTGDECQEAAPGSALATFEFPEGIAANNNPSSEHFGHVYVGDRGNNRIEELTAAGAFVSMFGAGVDKTTKAGICTLVSKDVCGAGVEGTAAGQFASIQSLSIDPADGSVYVQEGNENERVERYTAGGQFTWMIGGQVNKTVTVRVKALEAKGGTPTPAELEEENLCTASSGDECQQGESGAGARGSFTFQQFSQGLISAGGPQDLLYIGDRNRVQEFHADGTWAREVTTPGWVLSLAVDGAGGDLYVVYAGEDIIRRLDANGVETGQFAIAPRNGEAQELEIEGMALDAKGQLAITERENIQGNDFVGSVYDGETGRRITQFTVSDRRGTRGLAFDGEDLYAVVTGAHEIDTYVHRPVAELLSRTVGCTSGADAETNATLDCELKGAVDPWGVSETEVWFEWGRTLGLGEKTPPVKVNNTKAEGEEEAETSMGVTLSGLRPDEAFYFSPAGVDHNVDKSEVLGGDVTSFRTPSVAPRVVGDPEVAFVHSSSAVMFGSVNPENTATRYGFQYAPAERCASLTEGCQGTSETASRESPSYGPVGATIEATGLQPGTVYRYRLYAVNAGGGALSQTGGPDLPEGTFETAAALVPHAETGQANSVGVGSAVLDGAVDANGQTAVYRFELGVYAGTSTQYGIVSSGSADGDVGTVAEAVEISGLQPGTTYAYRISIGNGYGTSVGASQTFTTLGLPAIFSPEPVSLLPLPGKLKFPAAPIVKCKRGLVRDKHGKCVKAKTRKSGKKSARTKRSKKK